ncbi:uncharacterized protein LOC111037756 [Myzus persicae]|uniref:uncharacterized protein LOC111037756 n=1 Tax=Myzus persicae TaxID=13164 RepID=UPI000B932CF7|nr:uncharacterized protein LOC111037756 [Myzus persicae]
MTKVIASKPQLSVSIVKNPVKYWSGIVDDTRLGIDVDCVCLFFLISDGGVSYPFAYNRVGEPFTGQVPQFKTKFSKHNRVPLRRKSHFYTDDKRRSIPRVIDNKSSTPKVPQQQAPKLSDVSKPSNSTSLSAPSKKNPARLSNQPRRGGGVIGEVAKNAAGVAIGTAVGRKISNMFDGGKGDEKTVESLNETDYSIDNSKNEEFTEDDSDGQGDEENYEENDEENGEDSDQ